MRTSAPGNSRLRPPSPGHAATGSRGFTLIELLIVIAIVALASAIGTLSLRDPRATRLEREAQRLATLLDAARAQSRALGIPVTWRLAQPGVDDMRRADFVFDGLPPGHELPTRWLGPAGDPPIQVDWTPGVRQLTLGPEPLIGQQRVVLRLDDQRIGLASDGIGPFVPEPQ